MRGFKITERKTIRSGVTEKYFSDIYKIPILTPDQESDLAVKSMKGDLSAREKLVKSNLRFVVSVAKAYSGSRVPLMDLISQGNIGLIEASETFDPSMGFRFISYAVWRIRRSILEYINSKSRTIRIPQNILNAISEIKKINAEYNQKYERDATIQEIDAIILGMKDKTGISKNIYRTLAGIAADSFSIPLELGSEDDGESIKAPISWLESEDSGFIDIERGDLANLVSILLDKLNPVEKKIVTMKIGYDSGIPSSFDYIGSKFGKSKSWAENIFKKSIKKLKIEARKKKYDLCYGDVKKDKKITSKLGKSGVISNIIQVHENIGG